MSTKYLTIDPVKNLPYFNGDITKALLFLSHEYKLEIERSGTVNAPYFEVYLTNTYELVEESIPGGYADTVEKALRYAIAEVIVNQTKKFKQMNSDLNLIDEWLEGGMSDANMSDLGDL